MIVRIGVTTMRSQRGGRKEGREGREMSWGEEVKLLKKPIQRELRTEYEVEKAMRLAMKEIANTDVPAEATETTRMSASPRTRFMRHIIGATQPL